MVTPLDEWLYALKHAPEMEEQPDFLNAREIDHFFDLARYSNFTEEERHMYRTAQQVKWDNENALDFATNKARTRGHEEGIKEGIKEGIELERAKAEKEMKEMVRETARNFKNMGLAIEDIAKGTGLSIKEIEAL